jgi:hypothetical protein
MSLRTNLATRPFYNERAVQAVLVAAVVVVAAATVFNGWRLAGLTARDRALVSQATADDARARELRQQVTRARSGLDGARLAAVSADVAEANAIIDGRTFSWTAVFNWIESALPPDVRIVSITPEPGSHGRFLVGIGLEGKSVGAIDTFLGRLEGTGRFDGLLVRQERETEEGMIAAVAEGYYRPGDAPAEPVR